VEDFVRVWNALHMQESLYPRSEREVMLEINVPLQYDSDLFRVGWAIKRPGKGRYIALTTGETKWVRGEWYPPAEHVRYLLEAADAFVCERVERAEP